MDLNPLLGPVVALVAWTIIVLLWFAALLFASLGKMDKSNPPPTGARVRDIAGLPNSIQWKNHNYMHLLEQPTIFYAIVFALILMGDTRPLNLYAAWGYVGIRIAHSLVQTTVNDVKIRLPLFLLSTLCLAVLAVHASITAIYHL